MSKNKNICLICGRFFIYSRAKGHTINKCNSCSVNLRRLKIKEKAIEYKGGKCSKCGYNKCIRSLVFHHKDKKDFGISGSHRRRWEVIKLELDKCILLCSNCHGELHHELDN